MPALAGTSYDIGADFDRLMSRPVAAEVRTATDRPRPTVDKALFAACQERRSSRSTSAAVGTTHQQGPTRGSIAVAEVSKVFFDPWFSQTMDTLRFARPTVGDDRQDREAILASAEMLAAFLVDVDPAVRPQLSIDDDGNASYGSSTQIFYINLTIEKPKEVSWYAVVNGEEHFHEGVPFNGRFLPEMLRNVFKPSAI